jgi:hypothetical protein
MAEQHFAQSNSKEWYTPSKYLEAARALMGGIDLDPASRAAANERVQAAAYYAIEDNGFNREWHGRVFLNPPYGKERGKSQQEIWSHRLIAQYKAGITTEAVLLVTAATSEKWFRPLGRFLFALPITGSPSSTRRAMLREGTRRAARSSTWGHSQIASTRYSHPLAA